MLHMVGHAIFGLLIGLVARAIMPGGQHMGLILTMILGLVGAWLGGLIGRVLGMYEEGHPAGWFMALVGALVVLFVASRLVVRGYNVTPQVPDEEARGVTEDSAYK